MINIACQSHRRLGPLRQSARRPSECARQQTSLHQRVDCYHPAAIATAWRHAVPVPSSLVSSGRPVPRHRPCSPTTSDDLAPHPFGDHLHGDRTPLQASNGDSGVAVDGQALGQRERRACVARTRATSTFGVLFVTSTIILPSDVSLRLQTDRGCRSPSSVSVTTRSPVRA